MVLDHRLLFRNGTKRQLGTHEAELRDEETAKVDNDLCVEIDSDLTDSLVEGLTHQTEIAFLGAVSAAAKRKKG